MTPEEGDVINIPPGVATILSFDTNGKLVKTEQIPYNGAQYTVWKGIMTPEEVRQACELRLERTLAKMAYVPESIKAKDSEIFKAAVDHLMAVYQAGYKDGVKSVTKEKK